MILHDPAGALRAAASERILVLDGAMGTMIQALGLDEEAFRGAHFDAWNGQVRGNNDLLNVTQPRAIRDIHLAYFLAGADIVATNTFSSTSVAQADYKMSHLAYDLNVAGATLALAAARTAERTDGLPRFVAGALGPTNRSASCTYCAASRVVMCSKTIFNSGKSRRNGISLSAMNAFSRSNRSISGSVTSPCTSSGRPWRCIASSVR